MKLIEVQNVRINTFEKVFTGDGTAYYSVSQQQPISKSVTTKILVCHFPLYCEIHYSWTAEDGQVKNVIKTYSGLPFICSQQMP